MQRVLVINGPNLNLLGRRQPDVYGMETLADLERRVQGWGAELGLDVTTFQSNHEGEIIDRLHLARDRQDGLVINAGALTHYSYALHDAIVTTDLPAVEVHISNIHAREEWRRVSVTAPACDYQIFGRGLEGYRYGLRRLVHIARRPYHVRRYGDGAEQIGELRLPDGPGPFPVAVLIHGGRWVDYRTRDMMDAVAVGLAERGVATWNIEYRRVGSGGGWPGTLEDVAYGLDLVADLAEDHPLDRDRVSVIGHSAGGMMALWAAKRPHLYDVQRPLPTRIQPRAVGALAPVTDLVAAYETSWRENIEAFLRRTPEDGAERYRLASPSSLLPLEVPQLIVHGLEDESVDPEMSRAYAVDARNAGDEVELLELNDVGHVELVLGGYAAWDEVLDRLSVL